jgi:intein-encoded DNA endonuclease-like protein
MVELGTVHRVKSSITVERLKAYNKALELRKHGLGPRRISKIINVPPPTIGHWFYEGYHPLGATNRFEAKASPELAYVIGATLGDGYVFQDAKGHRYNVVLRVKDRDFAEAFSVSIAKLLGKQRPYKVQVVHDVYGTFYRVEVGSFELYQFLSKPLRELAPYIYAYPSYFLRGLYDAEGSIYNNGRGNWVIRLSNTRRDIIILAKALLERIGFHPILKYYPNHFGEYALSLHRQEEVKGFLKNIGFTIRRKQERMGCD